jgi:cobalamin transport system ATP-binding protein
MNENGNSPMIQVIDVTASYENQLVLQDVSFSLHAGEVLAVIGPNGVGKSTLIRALSRVVALQSGTVKIMDRDLANYDNEELARRIAVVPQASRLPNGFSAWETVLLGRTPHLNWLGQVSSSDENIARHAMQQTNTLQLSARHIGEVSGGEQQRLLLARALTQSAPILLLDEPTAHLDLQHQLTLLTMVQELAHKNNLAVLITLHDLNLVSRFADKVALLNNGRLHAIGTPDQVLTAPLLSETYKVPLSVIPHPQSGPPLIVPRM